MNRVKETFPPMYVWRRMTSWYSGRGPAENAKLVNELIIAYSATGSMLFFYLGVVCIITGMYWYAALSKILCIIALWVALWVKEAKL